MNVSGWFRRALGWQRSCFSAEQMQIVHRAMGLWKKRSRPRYALALAGGGVIGGMYEVGALCRPRGATGRPPGGLRHLRRLQRRVRGRRLAGQRHSRQRDLPDPRRGPRRSAELAARCPVQRPTPCGVASRFGRLMWAIGKHVIKGRAAACPTCWRARSASCRPDSSRWPRWSASSGSGWPRAVSATPSASSGRTLLIPAVDINTAERVVFGAGDLAAVPISDAVAASSAIPGFFDPYTIGGRDYVDGGVGFCGHADLAAEPGPTWCSW